MNIHILYYFSPNLQNVMFNTQVKNTHILQIYSIM